MGTLTSWNPLGHSRPVTGLLSVIGYKIKDGRMRTEEDRRGRKHIPEVIAQSDVHTAVDLISPRNK